MGRGMTRDRRRSGPAGLGLTALTGLLLAAGPLGAQSADGSPDPGVFPEVTAADFSAGVSQILVVTGRYQRNGPAANAGSYRFQWTGDGQDPIPGPLEYRLVGEPTWNTLTEGVESDLSPHCDAGNCTHDWEFRFVVDDGSMDPGVTYHATVTWTAYRANDPNTPQGSTTQALELPVGDDPELVPSTGELSPNSPTGAQLLEGRSGRVSLTLDVTHYGDWTVWSRQEDVYATPLPGEAYWGDPGETTLTSQLSTAGTWVQVGAGSGNGDLPLAFEIPLSCEVSPDLYMSSLEFELRDDGGAVDDQAAVDLSIDVVEALYLEITPGSIDLGTATSAGYVTAGESFTASHCGNVTQSLEAVASTEMMTSGGAPTDKPASDVEISFNLGSWTPLPYPSAITLEASSPAGNYPDHDDIQVRVDVKETDAADEYSIEILFSLIQG